MNGSPTSSTRPRTPKTSDRCSPWWMSCPRTSSVRWWHAMLQIIFFAIFLASWWSGCLMALTRAVDSLNEVFVQMVWVVMKAYRSSFLP